MSYSSCLAETTRDLLLDASVLINLSASGAAAPILAALPHRALVVDVAASEVSHDSRNRRSDGDALKTLLELPALHLVTLQPSALALFEQLVLAMDDGEAATIAAAAVVQGVAVLDERRARRICGQEFPELQLASTIDLFAHPATGRALGRDKLADAVHAALKNARMHVRSDQREWIVALIGTERAEGCKSIPRATAQPNA